MAKSEKSERKSGNNDNILVYNIHTAKWEAPAEDQQFDVDMHEAIRAGEKLPSDRTQEELDKLDNTPGAAGPVVTSGRNATPTSAGTDIDTATGTAATGTAATGTSGAAS